MKKNVGEMNLDETKDVITGPKRRLIQITMDNIEDAMKVLVDTEAKNNLMSEKKVIVDWKEALYEMINEQ